jgi:hypothetical protein
MKRAQRWLPDRDFVAPDPRLVRVKPPKHEQPREHGHQRHRPGHRRNR